MITRSQRLPSVLSLPYREEVVFVRSSDLYAAYQNDYIQFVLEQLFMTDEKKQHRYELSQQCGKDDYCLDIHKDDPHRVLYLNGRSDCRSELQTIASNLSIIFRPFFRNKQSHTCGRVDAIYRCTDDGLYTMVILDLRRSTKPTAYQHFKSAFYCLYAFLHLSVYRDRVLLHDVHTDSRTWIYPTEDDFALVREAVSKIRKAKRNAKYYWLLQTFPSWLYPNMKNPTDIWDHEKQELSMRTGEITMVWRCTPRIRDRALQHGVRSWHSSKCTAASLGFQESVYHDAIEAILHVNRTETAEGFYIHSDHDDFHRLIGDNVLYVDFEWIDSLYLIGIFNGSDYQALWADALGGEAVRALLQRASVLMENKTVVYWHAEKSKWNSEMEKHNMDNILCTWVDLCDIFRRSVAVRGAFTFKLKDIARAMYRLKYIPYFIDGEECQDGQKSMEFAREYYRKRDERLQLILERYNRFDCESMYHIAKTFTHHYTKNFIDS